MTFSIAARCSETGQFGVAVSSSSMAVGARCPWVLSGVGAVSSQNITLPALGPEILAALDQGATVSRALDDALARDAHCQYRQVTVIGRDGHTAIFSGSQTLGVHHAVQGKACVAAGNMLAGKQVIVAMVSAFEKSQGSLAERLILAMEAGLAAGGEAGPVHSAALKVVGDQSWPLVDLRVDWADAAPLARLNDLWRAWQPQAQDYLTRALDPRQAPGYGVPGDE
ncbi:DUF1028 domain-containing protein [Erwinia sp. S43]|uniref:DUF1028 domain-containing protein n=1 Tax=Erwinia sp. S43 TaxID=2769339 RepID=UPI001909E562|nr:DUF1028 domain-containing protein [Erwinia sp. S43]